MLQIEYEIERENIELAYRTRLDELQNKLRELAAIENDLAIQRAVNSTNRIKVQAHMDEIEKQRKEELLHLKKVFLIKGEHKEKA